jgi:hypothetical protein
MNKHELAYKIANFIEKEYDFQYYYFNIKFSKTNFTIGICTPKNQKSFNDISVYFCRQQIMIDSICCKYKSLKDIKSFIRKRFSELGILSKNEKIIKDIIE